ncbi:hypothetical protein [Pedobacter sp. MW01-1-1]|uniref:hypothetical protein n=1 Tax=Pedobacter sp. MW01-1-1 TaxID=3383027 RepID=UPI003FEFFC1D
MKHSFLFILLALLTFNLKAQTSSEKGDVVLKTNGEQMVGKVTQVTDNDISFIYTGETTVYVIKKADVAKITHANGRVETFATATLPAEDRKKDAVSMQATPNDHHNKIAILPFTYLFDNQPGAQEIGLKAQEDTYRYLSQHAAGYTIIDPRTTNVALNQAGATKDKIMTFTMKNLCDILGVEYIIDGSVIQTKGYQTTSNSGGSTTDVKRDDNDKVKKVNNYNNSYTNTAQQYNVKVDLHIYMDNNASIYNQSHQALFSNTNGDYSSPLQYLLKRSPLYRK